MGHFQNLAGKLPGIGAKVAPFAEKLDLALADDGPRSVAARSALFAFAVRVLAAVVAYGGQVVLARMLGAYEYGVYAIIWVWVVVISVFAGVGFPTGLLRFIPQLRDEGRIAELRGVIVKGAWFNVGLSTLIAAAGVAVIFAFPDLVSQAFVMPLVLAAFCLPMLTWVDNTDGVAQAYDWTDLVTVPPFLIRPLLILILFVAITAVGVPASATTAMIATVIGVWAITIGQFLAMRRRLIAKIGKGPMEGSISPWIAAAAPMILVEGFILLMINTDVLVAGWFIPPDQVAVYYAAAKTLALVHFVSFAIRVATMHKIAQYHAANDGPALRRTVADAINWMFWPTVCLTVMLLFAGRFILGIFGDGFEDGMIFLAILMAGVTVRSAFGPAEAMLTMANAQKTAAWVYGVVFSINLCLNLVLIPTTGLVGAAIATATAMLCEGVLLMIMVRRHLGIVSFIGVVGRLNRPDDVKPQPSSPADPKAAPGPAE